MAASTEDQRTELSEIMHQARIMLQLVKQHHETLKGQSERITSLTAEVSALKETVKRSDELQSTLNQISSSVQNLSAQDIIKNHEIESIVSTFKELSAKVNQLEKFKACDRKHHDQILENKHMLDLMNKELESVRDDCDRAKTDRENQFRDLNETMKELRHEVDATTKAIEFLSRTKSLVTWALGLIGTAIGAYVSWHEYIKSAP